MKEIVKENLEKSNNIIETNKKKIEEIQAKVKEKIATSKNINDINQLKVEFLGKKGPINELSSKIKEIPNEFKKEFGMLLNNLKTNVSSAIDAKIKQYVIKILQYLSMKHLILKKSFTKA